MGEAALRAATGTAGGERAVVDVSAALQALRAAWGDDYSFGYDKRRGYWWAAQSKAGTTIHKAGSPEELGRLLAAESEGGPTVIVYLWSAGTAEGVTDSPGWARWHAAKWMVQQQADTGRVVQARFIPGTGSLEDASYERLPRDPHWAGRRHPGGVSWELRAPAPKLAAS
jgi:hypothetical protein